MSWAEESYLVSPYVAPDPADKTLKYFFGDAEIKYRSPWFPRKKVTHWITWEIVGLDGRLVQVVIKPPLWYCSEN